MYNEIVDEIINYYLKFALYPRYTLYHDIRRGSLY